MWALADLDADQIFVAIYVDEKGASKQTQAKFKSNPLWGRLKGEQHEVADLTWMMAVGLRGAHAVLDDLAKTFKVDPVRP